MPDCHGIPSAFILCYTLTIVVAEERTGPFRGVIVIVGPTAVGKTAAAVELVSGIGGEIVSADSMAVYRGMDIGTAKPTPEERARARFHLVDVADPAQPFNVGEFQRLAECAIEEILATNPPAVIVGGSGLYVRAAVDGLNLEIPERDDTLRRKLAEEARMYGNERVHARLQELDPVSASRIHPNNLKRVIRAIEICEISGTPASKVFEADARTERGHRTARWFGLRVERQALYERIDKRVDEMIRAGLIDEVASLMQQGVSLEATSMQGLGYKEIVGFLRGDYSREEAVDLLKGNTRRFAKRQYTWFRAEGRIKWIDVDGMTAKKVSETIKGELSK